MVEILPHAGLGRLILRGDDTALVAGFSAFGVAMPHVCRAVEADGRATLWLGPDEFLLLMPQGILDDVRETLARALTGQTHALVDVTERQVALRILGARAANLLNAGCPLDLDPVAFPPSTCTRTLLGKAEIVLWRTNSDEFHLEAARSYLPYVVSFLREASEGGIHDHADGGESITIAPKRA